MLQTRNALILNSNRLIVLYFASDCDTASMHTGINDGRMVGAEGQATPSEIFQWLYGAFLCD